MSNVKDAIFSIHNLHRLAIRSCRRKRKEGSGTTLAAVYPWHATRVPDTSWEEGRCAFVKWVFPQY